MKKVITYGTYDLLHYGHIRLLQRAKALGDYLIVGVTADDFDKTRGKINVQQSLSERIAAVRDTGLADEIIVEEYEGQKIDDIRRLDVDIFTVGSDWIGYFDYLKESNIPFTIASASIKPNIDFFVESFHLDKWIEPSRIVYDDGTYENKIAMFKKAAHNIGVKIQDCLIIEDSVSGITNAYKAGCQNIVVVDSANKKEEYEKLPGVIQVIDSFENFK